MDSILAEKLSIVGTKTTCTGIAIIRDNKMLIGLRNYTPDKWKKVSVWTTPGGRCDAGETVEQALRRETDEETGIKNITINNFLGEVPGAMPGDMLFFFAGTTDEDPRLMEPEKFSEWKWCNLNDTPKNFINPAALVLIEKYLKFQF
jgi:ADP-ribose pyrophosphatase YjhB (NUDIX family)